MREPLGPVYVDLKREDDNVQFFQINAKSLPELTIDWSHLSKEEQDVEHFGARFLCAAALACFTNTFWNALKAEGVQPKSLTARASSKKEKDAIFRTRYSKILLEVNVALNEEDEEAFQSVVDALEMGSLVTYSLPEGIEVEHDIQRV
ncbi:MAG: OsmC family protein [Chloroflexota bacterium]